MERKTILLTALILLLASFTTVQAADSEDVEKTGIIPSCPGEPFCIETDDYDQPHIFSGFFSEDEEALDFFWDVNVTLGERELQGYETFAFANTTLDIDEPEVDSENVTLIPADATDPKGEIIDPCPSEPFCINTDKYDQPHQYTGFYEDEDAGLDYHFEVETEQTGLYEVFTIANTTLEGVNEQTSNKENISVWQETPPPAILDKELEPPLPPDREDFQEDVNLTAYVETTDDSRTINKVWVDVYRDGDLIVDGEELTLDLDEGDNVYNQQDVYSNDFTRQEYRIEWYAENSEGGVARETTTYELEQKLIEEQVGDGSSATGDNIRQIRNERFLEAIMDTGQVSEGFRIRSSSVEPLTATLSDNLNSFETTRGEVLDQIETFTGIQRSEYTGLRNIQNIIPSTADSERDFEGDRVSETIHVQSLDSIIDPVPVTFRGIPAEIIMSEDSSVRRTLEAFRSPIDSVLSNDLVGRGESSFARSIYDILYIEETVFRGNFIEIVQSGQISTQIDLYMTELIPVDTSASVSGDVSRAETIMTRGIEQTTGLMGITDRGIMSERYVEDSSTGNTQEYIGLWRFSEDEISPEDSSEAIYINWRGLESSIQTSDIFHRSQFIADRTFIEPLRLTDSMFRTLEFDRSQPDEELTVSDDFFIGYIADIPERTLSVGDQAASIFNYFTSQSEQLHVAEVFQDREFTADRSIQEPAQMIQQMTRDDFIAERTFQNPVEALSRSFRTAEREVFEAILLEDGGVESFYIYFEQMPGQVTDAADSIIRGESEFVRQIVSGGEPSDDFDRTVDLERYLFSDTVTGDEASEFKIFVDDFRQTFSSDFVIFTTVSFSDNVTTSISELEQNLQMIVDLGANFEELWFMQSSADRTVSVSESFQTEAQQIFTVLVQFAISDDIEGDVSEETTIISMQEDEVVFQPMFSDRTTGQFFESRMEARTGQLTFGLTLFAVILFYLLKSWRDKRNMAKAHRALKHGDLTQEERRKAEAYLDQLSS